VPLTASVAGASGYAGGELLRLLLGHPDIEIGAVAAGSNAALLADQAAAFGVRHVAITDSAAAAAPSHSGAVVSRAFLSDVSYSDPSVVSLLSEPTRRVIADKFKITYHQRSIGKLLKHLGFSHISARPRHPGQDGEVISPFKKIGPTRSRRTSRV
jgi:hypothetical protein